MKNLLVAALLLIGSSALAQTAFGIKGGLNYGATGEYTNITEAAGDVMTIDGKEKAGYHLGVFGKVGLLGFFLQPELVYTNLNTEYDNLEYKINKIDAPILVGLNILGPLHVKAGPSFQYILKNELSNSNLKISEVDNKITMGFQAGAGINLGRLGLDLRYEGGFKENNAYGDFAADNNISIDSRPSQWILGLSYAL